MNCPRCGEPTELQTNGLHRCTGCGKYWSKFEIASFERDALTAERDGYRAAAEERAQEVERLQGLVDYWKAEFSTTRKQRDALAQEVERLAQEVEKLRKQSHYWFKSTVRLESETKQLATSNATHMVEARNLAAEVERLRGALDQVDELLEHLQSVEELLKKSWNINKTRQWIATALAPHECAGDYCEACDKGGGE